MPSQLYSFSFAPNRSWTRSFSPQPEIQAYLQRVAREAGVLDRFRFGTTLTEARYDEDARVWRVATAGRWEGPTAQPATTDRHSTATSAASRAAGTGPVVGRGTVVLLGRSVGRSRAGRGPAQPAGAPVRWA